MPRFHRLAGAMALALGCTAGAAHAQQFSNFIVFGDSLSDAGNIAAAQGLPPGNSFTTNFDPVFAEVIAAAYGLPGANSLAGGPNFAWGGACVNPTGLCLNPVPNIAAQVTLYLDMSNGAVDGVLGQADGNALYSIWGGANDIFAALALDPANAQARTVAAATAYVQQIGRLQAAGANYIVVYNLPNLGVTPQFAASPAAGSVTGVTFVYNSALDAGLAQLGDGIISINTFGIISEIMANPGLYGFTNVTGQACGVGSSSVACGPAGSGLPFTYAPGTEDTWLFADGVHPTGAAHAILANVVMATIAAPIQFSYAGEAGVKFADNHRRAITDEMFSDFQLDRPVDGVRAWATGQFGAQDLDGGPGAGTGDADVMSLSLGANWHASENGYWGVALTVGNHDNDLVGANLDSTGVIGTIGGAWRFGGGGYVNGAIGGGSTDVEFERDIEMGATTRREQGSTNASQIYGELGIGWLFGGAGGLQHGPFVDALWVSQDVDDMAEESGDATSMNYSGFDRDSFVTSVGWQLMGEMSSGVRPYLRAAWNQEGEDEVILVNAGSNTMNGRFTMPGYSPGEDWVSVDLGVNWNLGEATTMFVGYTGLFGDGNEDANAFQLGLRTTF